MNYVEYINAKLRERLAREEGAVVFGQNMNTGSCLSGLTRGVNPRGGMVINPTNCENTLTGLGFGLALGGTPAVYFMKQLDFLMLGIDHLVNTFNFMRINEFRSGYCIFPIVVDSGWEGPMANFNGLADVCALGRVKGYTITNQADATVLVDDIMLRPGFRLIAVSQRLFRTPMMDVRADAFGEDGDWIRYGTGTDATVVGFNFSFPHSVALVERMRREKSVALYNVNSAHEVDFEAIMSSVRETRTLVVVDDSKATHLGADRLLAKVASSGLQLNACVRICRAYSGGRYVPDEEAFEIDQEAVIGALHAPSSDVQNVWGGRR